MEEGKRVEPQPNLTESDCNWIPDVKIQKVFSACALVKVWFTWRGKKQYAEMRMNFWGADDYWLIDDTKYTKDFEEWLDENLDDYDSLESCFESLLPNHVFEITYEQ